MQREGWILFAFTTETALNDLFESHLLDSGPHQRVIDCADAYSRLIVSDLKVRREAALHDEISKAATVTPGAQGSGLSTSDLPRARQHAGA